MRNISKIRLLLFSIIRSVCIAHASYEYLDKSQAYTDLDVGTSSGNILSKISLFGEVSDQTLKTGISFSESESSDDIYTGENADIDIGGVYVELGGSSNPDAFWGGIGFWGEISDYVTLKGGSSLLASESFDDTFTGGNLDLHFSFGTRFSPFVGAGIFGGYSRERVFAEDDNIDNDDDGFIDERGEKKVIVDDVIASVYPEAGFYFWVTDNVKLSFSGKYHVTTEGRDYDFWIFSSGFNFSFH